MDRRTLADDGSPANSAERPRTGVRPVLGHVTDASEGVDGALRTDFGPSHQHRVGPDSRSSVDAYGRRDPFPVGAPGRT